MSDKEYEIEGGETSSDSVSSNISVRISPRPPLIHIDKIEPLRRVRANRIEALMEGRVTGRNVANDCFIVQWIKGYEARIRRNSDGTIEREYLSAGRYNRREFNFPDYILDAPSGDVLYPYQDVWPGNANEILISDIPAFDYYKEIRTGTVEFRLEFVVAVFNYSDYPNPRPEQFHSPWNPMPLASTTWELNSDY